MAAKEDVSKPFEEDAGEILQLCDESNDEGHDEATYEFDVDEMKSQLGIDDIDDCRSFDGASEEKGRQFCRSRSRPKTG